jgi:hypothetical protein
MAKAKGESEFTTLMIRRKTLKKIDRLVEMVSDELKVSVERYDALEREITKITGEIEE